MTPEFPPVELVAHPAPANPPLVIALAVIIVGLLGPFVFLRGGSASPLLGIASLALGFASVIALAGALRGRSIVRADPDCRLRARIAADGVTILKAPPPASGLHFPPDQIAKLHFVPGMLVIHATQAHPSPGRHAIRFGKIVGDLRTIEAAIELFKLRP